MRKKLYAIRDTLAGDLSGGVLVLANDTVAIRFLGDVIAQGENAVAKHPNDHELVCLGDIESDGTISSEEVSAVGLPVEVRVRVVMTCRKYLEMAAALSNKEV